MAEKAFVICDLLRGIDYSPKILPPASFLNYYWTYFALHRGCSNIKVGFQPTGFENSSPIDLRGHRSPKPTRIHIPKCNTAHFTSHHQHKVTFPSIVINAPSYPAGRNVLHFQNVTLSVKMDHQTAPQPPRCIFPLTGRLSFHVFHCGHWFRSLKRPINRAAGRLQK